MSIETGRLIVVSNRLPMSINGSESRGYEVTPSTGGLVTALAPVMSQLGGAWIGWPGCSSDIPYRKLLQKFNEESKFELLPVDVTEDEIAMYYRGFSNKALWPLFHDLLGQFTFNHDEFEVYQRVNNKFADVVARMCAPDDHIWIHDYQLFDVGHYLRQKGIPNRVSFFLHIPFPSIDLLRRYPRNKILIERMLAYDHIGFQTATDKRNFVACVKWLIPETNRQTRRQKTFIEYHERKIEVGHYPISIDFDHFHNLARSREAADAAWYLKENIRAERLVLGLDRLDYTKGIPERFLAFERFLEKYPDAQGKTSLLQVVIPSRLNVEEYRELKEELDYLAGRINGRFTVQGWIPIHYLFRTLDDVQLVGHYLAADVAFVTPLRDGMNLVSKEYCVSSIDNHGVLILSEFAGSATQLKKGAILVNPFDIDGTADALQQACTMPLEEQEQRMRAMRADIRRHDVHRWVRSFTGKL